MNLLLKIVVAIVAGFVVLMFVITQINELRRQWKGRRQW